MRSRRHKLQVSTFPFLAVLLCAMGALLLVLLVMDRRAHAAALARAEQALQRTLGETTREAEARRLALEAARKEADDAREQKRAAQHARLASQIGEVDAEIQTIREQLAKAAERLLAEQNEETALKQKIEAEQTRATGEEQAIIRVRAEAAAKTTQSESSRQALTEMTSELARLERALADLKAAREKEKNTYSVVPYNGKRGESRRPLYIECAAGEVIFHPDHAALAESRDSADVQAEVERRLLKQKQQLPSAEAAAFTPYLMLLVRPDGVLSYYHLRESLRGLKIDFGYEFIDRDWVLDFPTDDAAPAPQSWVTIAKPADGSPSSGASGLAMNLAPKGAPSARLSAQRGIGPGMDASQPPANGLVGGDSRSGNGESTAPPPLPGPILNQPPPSASAATPAASDASVVLPELGPPRANTGITSGTAATAPAGVSGAPDAPSSPTSAPSKSAPAEGNQGDDDPFLRATPTPKLPNASRPPAPLRPARLSGDRDWIVFVECKKEGVVIYPAQMLIPVSALDRASGGNPLLQSVQQLIDRKQATVRSGDAPYRPEVRFLVHPDAGRTYHLVYPTLDALAAPKTAQPLAPEDDVAAIVAAAH